MPDNRTTILLLLPMLTYVILKWLFKKQRQPLPPGPPGLPFLGNVEELSRDFPWLHYAQLKKQYGDVVHFNILGYSMIVLNSAKAITELMEKRSSNYADRPIMPMNNEIMGWQWNFGLMRYNETWRKHRKLFHQYFQQSAVATYHPVQIKATHILLRNLLDRPDKFMDHVRLLAGSIILQLTYGYDIQGNNDYYVSLAASAREGYAPRAIANSYLVDFIPLLKHMPAWFPGATFKKNARKWKSRCLALRDQPYELFKATSASGVTVQSFVAENLEKAACSESAKGDLEETIKGAAGAAYFSGAETTVSVILSFILAMVLHPSVARRAQQEIESVIGKDSLPGFEDRPMLPFVEAILLESLRWNPVAPLGVPHANVDDDEYEGYAIPAGSTIIGNIWAVFHDDEVFEDPMVFNPERFYKTSMPLDPTAFAFGFGRRICPARYLAMDTAWIAIAMMLSAFDLTKAKDITGNDIQPSGEYTSGHTSRPLPFPCEINPRSEAYKKLILAWGAT